MRIKRLAIFVVALAIGAGSALLLTPAAVAAKTAGRDGEAEKAANAFLASLTAELREKVAYALDAPSRCEFHFVPRDRIGAPLLDLLYDAADTASSR